MQKYLQIYMPEKEVEKNRELKNCLAIIGRSSVSSHTYSTDCLHCLKKL